MEFLVRKHDEMPYSIECGICYLNFLMKIEFDYKTGALKQIPENLSNINISTTTINNHSKSFNHINIYAIKAQGLFCYICPSSSSLPIIQL